MNGFPRISTFGLLALCALGVMAGCKKDDPNESVTGNQAKTKSVADGQEVSTEGVSLTFPKDWKKFDLTKGELEQAVAGGGKDEKSQMMLDAVRKASSSGMVKFMIFDPNSSKPGFVNNANLVITPGVGSATVDQLMDASKGGLTQMGAKVTTSKVTFPAGEFGRMESHLQNPNGQSYVAIGYLQPRNGTLTVVTFSCVPDQLKAFDAKAQSIMQTFKYK